MVKKPWFQGQEGSHPNALHNLFFKALGVTTTPKPKKKKLKKKATKRRH